MWLNLVISTKLPTYPGKGSSHHVVQQFFFLWLPLFFLIISFWRIFFFCFFFILFNNFFFSAWLNSVKDTKLPTYPWEGSSHYVVQKIFFFYFLIFFFVFLMCFCKKGGAVCNSGYHHWSNPRWPQGWHGRPTATLHSQLLTWSGINFSLLVHFQA